MTRRYFDERKTIKKWWFQHVAYYVRHVAWPVHLFRFIQGKKRVWHCGALTLKNSQESCFVCGPATATRIGADYPFDEPEARRSFNCYGSIMYSCRFSKAKARKPLATDSA